MTEDMFLGYSAAAHIDPPFVREKGLGTFVGRVVIDKPAFWFRLVNPHWLGRPNSFVTLFGTPRRGWGLGTRIVNRPLVSFSRGRVWSEAETWCGNDENVSVHKLLVTCRAWAHAYVSEYSNERIQLIFSVSVSITLAWVLTKLPLLWWFNFVMNKFCLVFLASTAVLPPLFSSPRCLVVKLHKIAI